MSKTDFLKQAIADATEIQRSSVELAKKSLSEAFDSQLKSMLAAKLQEEAEEMDEEITEEDDLAHEAFDDTLEEEKDSDAMDSDEPPMEEEYDLDEILAEMDGEDDEDESEEKENVDEAKEEDEDTEEQEEHEKSESDEEEEKEEEEVDEEFNLEALLRELSMSEEAEEAPEEAPEESEDDEVKKMEEQLFELKNKLNEVNLLNAKLLYLNKVLAENDSLTAPQKVKLISTFDEASSVKEVKLVHKTITEAFKVKQNSTKKVTQLKESVKSFASNPAGDSKKMDKEIDTNPLSSLWQRIKKY
jgi:hypothetical protein